MLTANELRNSVNTYTGQVRFSITLAHLAGRNGLDAHLELVYDGNVSRQATRWNQTDPTGVAGLGWTVPVERIVAVSSGVAAAASQDYFLDGGEAPARLYPTGAGPTPGTLAFATETYAAWQVIYDPSRERWEVTREDGTTSVFGDAGSGRNTVQWGVAWGDWIGQSSRSTGQSPVALAWSLSEADNRFGDRITYAYDVDTAAVGTTGLSFTRASYLTRITGVLGDQIVLTYGAKTEVAPPHTGTPNAWQDRYESRFLQTVAAISPDGTVLYTETLAYGGFLGTGALAKRLFTSLSRSYPSGQALPATLFAYYTQAGAPSSAYGAIQSVTLSEGGTVTWEYQAVSPSQSARDLLIGPPPAVSTTFTQPQLWFQRDYVVGTWLSTVVGATSMRLLAYSWDGRWLPADLGTLPAASATAYAAASVAVAPNLFAVYTGGQLHLYRRNRARAGEWIAAASGSSGFSSLAIPAGNAVALVAGDDFATLLDRTAGRLFHYVWNGAAWVDATPQQLDAGGVTGASFAVAASGDVLIAGAAALATPNPALFVYLFHRDALGVWSSSVQSAPLSVESVDAIELYAGRAFAAYRARTSLGASTRYAYGAVTWSAAFDALSAQAWSAVSLPAATAPVAPVLCGDLAVIGPEAFRYDGARWAYFDTDSVTYPGQQAVEQRVVGLDCVARRIRTSNAQNPYVFDLLSYQPSTGQWAPTSAQQATALFALSAGSAVQPSGYAAFGAAVYAQAPGGTWASAITLPAFTAAAEAASLALAPDYLVYQIGATTQVQLLRNGGAAADASGALLPVTSLAGESVYAPAAGLGEMAFATYQGPSTAPVAFKLYRAVGDAVSGPQAAAVVARITCANGFPAANGIGGPVVDSLVFDPSMATMAPLGNLPQFNRAIVYEGAAAPSPSAPSGRTEHYFFNGLTPAETPLLPYPVDAQTEQLTNAPSYYSLVRGLGYATESFDASSASVGSTEERWWVSQTPASPRGIGTRGRVRQATALRDGVLTVAQDQFADETGLVKTRTFFSYAADGTSRGLVCAYTYFWERYDPTRALNLLQPIVETVNTTTAGTAPNQTVTVTSDMVTTWKDSWGYGSGQWNAYRTYRATTAGASPFTWWDASAGEPPASAGWLRTASFDARSAAGISLVSSDVDGLPTSTLLDAAGTRAVATVEGADERGGEVSYLGFEPYEGPGGWAWSGAGEGIAAHVSTEDFHTGTRSLIIPPSPGAPVGPSLVVRPATQSVPYLFSCWATVDAGFLVAQGAAQWVITVSKVSDGTAVPNAVTPIDLSGAAAGWTYFQKVIDLPAILQAAGLPAGTTLRITLTAQNLNAQGMRCFVDELRFAPLDAELAATVFDPSTGEETADIGSDGQSIRTVRDGLRQVVAFVGPADRVGQMTVRRYARAAESAGAFDPAIPNAELSISSAGVSRHYDFHKAPAGAWIYTPATDWATVNGELTYQGSSGTLLAATAVLDDVVQGDFAARVRVLRPPSGTLASAALGNGDVYMEWQESVSAWRLIRNTATQTRVLAYNDWLPFQEDWVFAVVGDLVTCYAGGVEVFSTEVAPPATLPANYGRLALSLDHAASFDDLLLMASPRLSLAFYDGLGAFTQSIDGEQAGPRSPTSYQTLASGRWTDALGRPMFDREPLTAPLTFAPAGTSTDPRSRLPPW